MKNILFLLVFSCSLSAFSQNVDYESVEELLYDIHSRNFANPIAYMTHQMDSIEQKSKEEFSDTLYIGMANLLASTYLQNNQIYEADTLLNHSINFIIKSGRKSPLAYALFLAYGSLQCQMQNYDIASMYLEAVIEVLANQNDMGENYAVVKSMLATCHMNMDSLNVAKQEIDESIAIIEKTSSRFALANKMGIYQKAGAIYHELGMLDKAEDFTKIVYEFSKDDDNYISEFINAASNLAVLYLDSKNYLAALEVLHELEKKPLSEIEKSNVFNHLSLANYFLGNEDETVKYAILCSNSLKKSSSELYASFPTMTFENQWKKSLMQLKVNMSILDKFSHNGNAVGMCYDNAIFVKSLAFNNMERLRVEAQKDKEIENLFSEIRQLKSERFAGNSSVYKELNQKERDLIGKLATISDEKIKIKTCNWNDVKKSLHPNEYAIEIVTYSGYNETEEEHKELRYAALLVSPEMEQPTCVDLCTYSKLGDVLLSALKGHELGINNLYLKGNEDVLYHLVWEKIEPYLKDAKKIYISPILDIQYINIGYIPCPEYCYLNEKYDIKTVTSSSEICRKRKMEFSDAAIWGGIEYSKEKINQGSYRGIVLSEFNDSTRGTFGYLRASGKEVDTIQDILEQYHISSKLFKGSEANEKSFRDMDGCSSSILHLSTHGFYLVGFDKYLDYFGQLLSSSHQDNYMLFSGLLLADANTTLNNSNESSALNDGIITAEEISFMDLSHTELAVLSACKTGVGINDEGFGGLIRALKIAGVKHIIASLWDVPDVATAKLMMLFYQNLTSGQDLHIALLKAQQELSKQYPDPYYWASFILLD